ncbi:MAG: hypothetical protein VX957_03175 [Candidatus Neomarinimicrobiota bacterium]|nr:hypothetical protein [Candidatus Neomarinimicrobiota bacterium]
MKQKVITFSFMVSLSFGLDLRPIQSIQNWNILQSGNITIEWTKYEDFPISRAETMLHHPMNEIASVIQDLKHYPDIFKRVTSARQLGSDVAQIVLDMPFPFDGRDYIIKYQIEKLENKWIFLFSAVDHPQGILDPNHVRLPNAAGIWILTEQEANKTSITYAWNGALLGNFPDFALHRAWTTQGTEVLNWLDQALPKKNH